MSRDGEPDQGSLFGGDVGIGDAIGALERWCARGQIEWIVGVDEAGRGPLAGPVHAAAVGFHTVDLDHDWVRRLDDSKKLTEEEREELFEEIRENVACFEIASVSPREIDELNILNAARRAMAEAGCAVADRLDAESTPLFVDGNVALEIDRRQRTLVRGDGRSYAIAAASILAKVSRDRVMETYHERWPVYAFDSNKGYPTRAHREALEQHGPCEIHRRSFSGVRPS